MKKQVEGLKLESQEPLNDGGRKYNVIYFILGVIGLIAGAINADDTFGGAIFCLIIGLVLGWGVKTFICSIKLNGLRSLKFHLYYQISNEELLNQLIPVLTPLGMTVVKLKEKSFLKFCWR